MDEGMRTILPETFSSFRYPGESFRENLLQYMACSLSTETFFTDNYGVLGWEEAYENAKRIERTCFDKYFMGNPFYVCNSGRMLYYEEAISMMLEVLERAPRTTLQKSFWEDDWFVCDMLESKLDYFGGVAEVNERHGAEFLKPVPTTESKLGSPAHWLADTGFDISGRKRAFSELAVETKEPTNPFTLSNKRICLNSSSFGIDDASVDNGDALTKTALEEGTSVGIPTSTHSTMKSVETEAFSSNPCQASGSKTPFVEYLSSYMDLEQVKHFVEEDREVVDDHLATFKDKHIKGFGHVEFATAEAAQKALEFAGHDLMGQPVVLDPGTERGAHSPGSK